MLAASLLLFLLFELMPGDVAVAELGPYSTPEQRDLWMAANGYDQPAMLRYFAWLGHFAIGQWGKSRIFLAPVARIVGTRLENTAILGFWFFAVLIPLSLGMGVLAGMREGSWLDRAVSAICILTTSVPPFASTGPGLGGVRVRPALAAGHQHDAGRVLLSAACHAGDGAGAV